MRGDEQISEIAKIILDVDRSYYGMECDEIQAKAEANAIYAEGYRKIYDDHQRQCTCYALGCQMAEELKRKVAREIFEEIESCIWSETHYGDSKLCFEINSAKYAELKKKYTEEGK